MADTEHNPVGTSEPTSQDSSSNPLSPQSITAVAAMKNELGLEVPAPAVEGLAPEHYVPVSQKLTYGAPQLVTMAATFLLNVYGNRFYSLLGAPLSALAFYTALARSLDCLTDPVMGWWSDSTRSKHGRRRPYIAVGCIFYAVAFLLLCSPPDFGDAETGGQVTAAWFGMFYIIFYLCDTLSNIPYFAWGPELTPDYQERNKVFFVAKIFYFFGMLISAMGPPLLYAWLRSGEESKSLCSNAWDYSHNVTLAQPVIGEYIACNVILQGGWCWQQDTTWFEAVAETIADTCKGAPPSTEFVCTAYSYTPIEGQRYSFTLMAALFGTWYVLSMGNLVHRMREKGFETLNDPVPLLPAILRSLKNVAFQPLIFGWALDAISISSLGTLFPFFIEYVIKPNGEAANAAGWSLAPDMALGLCMLALLVSALFSMPLWLFMSQHFGKYNCFTAFNLVNAATVFLFYFASEGDVKYVIFVAMLCGIPVGGQFLTDSILADTIDYDEFLNGTRSEGSYTVFATLIPKFVSIPSSAVPLALLAVLGFRMPVNGVAADQPGSVETFIRMTFVFVPFVCCCVSFVVKLYFPIKTEEISVAITAGIRLHEEGAPALDPITGRMINVLTLNPQQIDSLWKYEYYSFEDLAGFLSKGPEPLNSKMQKLCLGCLSSFVIGTSVSILMYPQLSNAGLSIIPVISIIVSGISLTGSIVNIVRWCAACGLRSQPSEVAKVERSLVRRLIKAKGIGLGVDDEQSLSAQISRQMSRRALQSSNGFHIVMSLALIGYGSSAIYFYPNAWFGTGAVTCGCILLIVALFGFIVVKKEWEIGMRAHFLMISCSETAIFVVCVLSFLFQQKLKTYVLYNPEEFLDSFPSDFCNSAYAELTIYERDSCASKLSDKCFEIMATVGIFCLVGVIVGLLTIFTEYTLIPSDKLITPLTVLFSLLIGTFNILVLTHAIDILKQWPEMMGLIIGGLQFESVVISAIVSAGVVLLLAVFTGWVVFNVALKDETQIAIKRVTVSITLQATAALLLIAVAIVTISLVKQMEPHVILNFDSGDKIADSVSSTYCNRDSTSYATLSCNALDGTGKLRWYRNDDETSTNEECLKRSECVTKLVTALKASGSMLGFFMLCEFFYTLCIVTWLFRFLNRIKGNDLAEGAQLANLHKDEADKADEEEEEEQDEAEDAGAVLQQEVAFQEKIRNLESRIREAVAMEHYMEAAALKEERDKYQQIQRHQQAMNGKAGRDKNPFGGAEGEYQEVRARKNTKSDEHADM